LALRWTRKGIVAEIKRLHADGAELNYATAEDNHLNLVRAAAWHFGTWRRAVEAARIDYESISKYQRWDRKRIVARIRELHHEGADLNWRAVSTQVDPPLAAAALRPNGFQNWREAIEASGLDINNVARYQAWDEERVVKDIKALHRARKPLSSKAVQVSNQPLFCAARRRFGSWDEALVAAGLSVARIRLRQPAGTQSSRDMTATVHRNGSATRAAGARNTATAVKPRAATAGKTTAAQARTARATTAPARAGKAATTPTKATQVTSRTQIATRSVGKGAKVSAQTPAAQQNRAARGVKSAASPRAAPNARTQPATGRKGAAKSPAKAPPGKATPTKAGAAKAAKTSTQAATKSAARTVSRPAARRR
jgi:hypothetical protein